MKTIRRNGHWIIALVGILSLAFSAGVMAQKQPALSAPQNNGHTAHAVAEANELSHAFRHASKEALPGMVSIETQGRVAMIRGQGNVDPDQLFENSPFGEMFKNDPRMKEFFRRQPQQAPRSHGMGSGFVIDPSGVILTANHVVADAEKVKVKLHDGREYMATDVKTDPKTDVAIIRIKAEASLPVIRLGDSDAMEIGDWVLAIGSPFGLDATVTAGIISAKGRGPGITAREDFLQTDAAINPGNSGGPLINLNGEVIGINTAISTRSGGYDGVGFAVPINLARWVAEQLMEKGEVTRAYVGVTIQPVDSELSKQFNVPVGKGALITQVLPDSPASAAKLEAGDLVLKFNGKEVHGPRDMQLIVERVKAGSSYPMLIVRDGKEMTVNVPVKEMPRDFTLARDTVVPDKSDNAPSKSDTVSELGIGIEAASPDVLKQLGYKDPVTGVVINSVKEDSPAANAGLREGMVIEKVGSHRVSTPAEFRDALKGLPMDKGVLLLARSPRGSQFVVVQPESK
ncbi:MAG TPA: Do family serine endopeptidase [Planctomycetaceae bacterium]|nr:Do family serine endopeptidase [Planctomycetaceae bacterium]